VIVTEESKLAIAVQTAARLRLMLTAALSIEDFDETEGVLESEVACEVVEEFALAALRGANHAMFKAIVSMDVQQVRRSVEALRATIPMVEFQRFEKSVASIEAIAAKMEEINATKD